MVGVARQRMIKKKLDRKTIKCMNYDICGNKFLSEHKFHRLCANCRKKF